MYKICTSLYESGFSIEKNEKGKDIETFSDRLPLALMAKFLR
jgi:hypothetical protein